MSDQAPRAGVLAASPSELGIMRQTGLILEKFGIAHEIRIMSSSRNPDLVDEYARTAFERGIKVIVCSTGLSGHLAAAVAAREQIGDHRWLHAGQSNFHDIVPTNALGIPNAWINRKSNRALPGGAPGMEFPDLAGLANALT